MKCARIVVIVSLLFSIKSLQGQEVVYSDTVSMNFATNLYPASPMKKLQSLTMKLWGYVDGATAHPEIRTWFLANQEEFVQQVVTLHSICDLVLFSLYKQVHEHPERVAQAIYDFQHIIGGMTQMVEQYEQLMKSYDEPLAFVADYILRFMINKMQAVLETGTIVSPLYAFVGVSYSSETTPLFPPAII